MSPVIHSFCLFVMMCKTSLIYVNYVSEHDEQFVNIVWPRGRLALLTQEEVPRRDSVKSTVCVRLVKQIALFSVY